MKIAIIGGGKMGEAILKGLLASKLAPADELDAASFVVANPGLERRTYLQQSYGVACVEQAPECGAADVVILAVKPQVMGSVLDSIHKTVSKCPAYAQALYISIAAGITTSQLRAQLPEGARVVRTMPNTPLMVGAGITAVVSDGGASCEDVALVQSLFACLGTAVLVKECEMDAVCAVSGSGPAYMAAMIEALRDGGVEHGLSPQLATSLALQTMLGTARLIHETGASPEETRISVCSPGGTTLAALEAMNARDFSGTIQAGVAAATKRSKELGA